MKKMRRFVVVGVLSALVMAGFGARPGMAEPRAHVYLLRGLLNIFSLGMDNLAARFSATASMRRFTIIRSGRRLPITLPPRITPARKVLSSLLGIHSALMR